MHRLRTDAAFGVKVIQHYSGESDRAIVEASYVWFVILMGGTMFPSLEGVRAAGHILHRLGVIPRQPRPEEFVDSHRWLRSNGTVYTGRSWD